MSFSYPALSKKWKIGPDSTHKQHCYHRYFAVPRVFIEAQDIIDQKYMKNERYNTAIGHISDIKYCIIVLFFI